MAHSRVIDGREAFSSQSWAEAYEALSAAADEAPLECGDLERLAIVAYLVGEDAAADDAWARAHDAWLAAEQVDRSVRCAVWLAMTQMLRGDSARAGGWLSRASRIVDDDHDGPAAGYLLIPAALDALESDPPRSVALAEKMHDIAGASDDPDLLAMALLALGEASIASGDIAGGTGFLDEAMLAVTSGRVSPIPSGIIYCAVLLECAAVFDVQRAAEWTEALSRWCEAQPDLVPYRGQCLVHRAEVLQRHGEWREAAAEVTQARARLTEPPHPALGLACYQQAELHRLRGEFADAEAAYREASRQGRDPAPGLPLLRLAEGRTEAASAAIRRALREAHDPLDRVRLLGPAVEIALAAGNTSAAEASSNELAARAAELDAPLLHARAGHAAGMVAIARGDPSAALAPLRAALARWRELEMPYEEARTRAELGRALRGLDDFDSADLELGAARVTFEHLGAKPALDELTRAVDRRTPGNLTVRECEVLRLVAAGRTNRQIADALVISEHTVARHVQNIFVKLDVSTRSAATAFAYQHDLA